MSIEMTKIRGTPPGGTQSPGEVQSTQASKETQASQATGAGEQGSPPSQQGPLSQHDASQRRVEHRLDGILQEARLRGESFDKDDVQRGAQRRPQVANRPPATLAAEQRAEQFMTEGRYSDAAQEYRQLARQATSVSRPGYQILRNRAEVLADMQTAGVQNLQNPPTEQNTRDYFSPLRGADISAIQQRYERFADAFFTHSDTGLGYGDTRYDPETRRHGSTRVTTFTPEDWADIMRPGTTDRQGRFYNDCEGFAYMGRVALEAAGFGTARFADMRPGDGTPHHMVITASRQHHGQTEIALISNDRLYAGTRNRGESTDRARTRMLEAEFLNIMGRQFVDHAPGNPEAPPRDRMVQHQDQAMAVGIQ